MPSSGMLHRATFIGTEVLDERSAPIIKVISIDELRTTLAERWLLVTANVVSSKPILVILIMKGLRSYEASALTRATRRNIPEDGILERNQVSEISRFF
jgi:hypothetical protein